MTKIVDWDVKSSPVCLPHACRSLHEHVCTIRFYSCDIIIRTSPCDVDPLTSQFYIQCYKYFLTFAPKHILWRTRYSHLHEAVIKCTYNLCYETSKKNKANFLLKINSFYSCNIISLLHRRVNVTFYCISFLFLHIEDR